MKTKLLAIMALLLCLGTGVEAKKRVMKNPQVVFQMPERNEMEISRVVMSDKETVVSVRTIRNLDRLVTAPPTNTYLEDGSGRRYWLRNVSRKSAGPRGTHEMSLVFDAVPAETEALDLRLSTNHGINFYGIHEQGHAPAYPDYAEIPAPESFAALMQRKGKAYVGGKIENAEHDIYPFIRLEHKQDPFHTYEEKHHKSGFVARHKDGTLTGIVELDRPTLAQMVTMEVLYNDDGGFGQFGSFYDWVWLVPGDTTEVFIDNNGGRMHDVQYSDKSVEKALKYLPDAAYNKAWRIILRKKEDPESVSQQQLDSVMHSLRGLCNYLIWSKGMNDWEKYMTQRYFAMLDDNIRTLNPQSDFSYTIDTSVRFNPEGTKGGELLEALAGDKRGRYVFINPIRSFKDIREVDNVLADMKGSKDFAFVYVVREGAFSESELTDGIPWRLRGGADLHVLPEEDYLNLLYLGAMACGHPSGLTLDREGMVMPTHTFFDTEYNMRRKIRFILSEEEKAGKQTADAK